MDQRNEQITELVANLDDASPEVIGATMDALFQAGALDVWTTAISMKKNRPGVMLSVLCPERIREEMIGRMITETGTFGVRHRLWDRVVLSRRHETVDTDYGPIRMKIGTLDDMIMLAKPEFEDVRNAAKGTKVSVRVVMEHARSAAEAWLRHQTGEEGRTS